MIPAIDPRLTTPVPWIESYLTPKLPRGWEIRERRPDGAQWFNAKDHLSVILSGAVERDGKRWLHVSCARRTYIPTYGDLVWMKETFLGPDLYAVQIFAPRAVHVNLHPYALHLFACLDDWPLPEFSGFVPSVAGRTL